MKEDQVIQNLAFENPAASATQISQQCKSMGITASATTVRRRLRECGMQYSHPISKPLLKKIHRNARVQFATQNRKRDWSNVLFTDETTFQLFPNPRKYWMFKRYKLIYRRVKHPPKIHAWGCFSRSGFGKIITFTGILNAKRMKKIYKQGLKSSASYLFEDDWILQEDNDSEHMSNLCKKWKSDNSIDRLDWPIHQI